MNYLVKIKLNFYFKDIFLNIEKYFLSDQFNLNL